MADGEPTGEKPIIIKGEEVNPSQLPGTPEYISKKREEIAATEEARAKSQLTFKAEALNTAMDTPPVGNKLSWVSRIVSAINKL